MRQIKSTQNKVLNANHRIYRSRWVVFNPKRSKARNPYRVSVSKYSTQYSQSIVLKSLQFTFSSNMTQFNIGHLLRTFELSYIVKNMPYIMLNWFILDENVNCKDLCTINWEYRVEYFERDTLKLIHVFECFGLSTIRCDRYILTIGV